MTVAEQKTKDGWKYFVPIKDGKLEYFTDTQIVAVGKKRKEDILDDIFNIIINGANKGSFKYLNWEIRYFKKIDRWLKK
jgi:hypothetical protein